MYVEQDFVKARNCFYKAAVSAEYMIKMYGWELQTGTPKICYAILSDNTNVIERYTTIKDINPDPNFIGYQFVTSVQSILQNNMDELETQIIALKKSTISKRADGYKGLVTVFEGFRNKDKFLIESGLNELIKTHKKREKIALVSDYFSVHIAAVAKLSLRIGIDVNIKSSLLPLGILPINELSQYDGYDFFKELDMAY